MYRIYYNNEVVYDPFVPEEYAFGVTCNGGVNDKGSMRFSVGYGHRLYNEFKVRQGLIRFTHDGRNIFAGYIDQLEKNFNLDLEITCYGILGHLNDVLLRPYTTYQGDEGEFVLPSSTELFAWYIKKYNEKATHPFIIGYNEGNDIYNGNLFRSNTSISSVGKEIESQLISTVGGYVTTRVEGETWYIDYKKDVGDVNNQIIDFGVNLLDYTFTDSASGIYTAVVVSGGTDEKGNEITIDPVTVQTDGEFFYEKDTITNLSAAQKYGYRETHYSNTDAETPQELLEAAVAYLKIVSKPAVMLVCKAVDMSLYMDGYKHLAVGEIVRVRSYPHGIDEYMVVTEIDVDLDNPENTEYTLGVVYDTLTGEQSSKLKDLNNNLDRTLDSVDALGQDVIDAAEDAKNALDKSNELEQKFIESEFERSQFEKSVKDSILDLQKIADGAIETWFYPHNPQLDKEPTINWKTDDEKYNHIGDLFYNTETGKAYRWMYAPNSQGEMVYSWGPIIDTDIEEALRLASKAQDTADSKRRVFYDTPYPPYDEGDLWAQGYGGDILMSIVDRHSGEFNPDDWIYAAKYSKAVYSTEEQFYQSDSPDILIGGTWTTENNWIDGKYTWRRTLVTYGNGMTEWEPSENGICITGNTGEKGEDGVGIVSVDVEYYLSRYSDRLAGDIWHTDPPNFIEGRFMWSRTKVVYTDGRVEYTPSENGACIAVSGTEGSNGVGISYIEEQYVRTKSNSIVPTSGWSSKYPGWVEGEFLWTRSVIYYSDGSNSITDPICVSGIKGDKGEKGTSVTNVDVWYYLSRSSTELIGSTWVTDPPQWVEGRFMWTKTITYYSDGTKEETKPVCIALSGKDGTNGLGVSYLEEQYIQTASNTTAPNPKDPGWSSKYPGVSASKPYIWTRTVIYYSDGSNSMTDPVCVTGPKGDTGTGVSSIVEHYLASVSASGVNKNTPGWSTDPTTQVMTATKKYLWNYTTTNYTNGTSVDTTPAIIGVYGDKGENGTNGKDGTQLTGTSSTDASALAKVASVDGFAWKEGVCITVVFTNGNTAIGTTSNHLTLKVNNDSSRDILTNGSNSAFWQAKEPVTFVGQNGVWNVASSPVWGSTNTIGNPVGQNVYIDGTAINFRNSNTINASINQDTVNLGKNSTASQIYMCGETVKINSSTSGTGNNKTNKVEIKSGNSGFLGSSILLANLTSKSASAPTSWVELSDTGSKYLYQLYMAGVFPIDVSANYNSGNVTGVTTELWGNNVNMEGTNFNANSKNINIGGNATTISSTSYTLQSSYSYFTGTQYSFQASESVILGFEVYKNSSDYKMYGGRRLYTGDSNGTIRLSDSSVNYAMFDIYYRTDDQDHECMRVINPNGKSVSLTATAKYSQSVYVKSRVIMISGDSIYTHSRTNNSNIYANAEIKNNASSAIEFTNVIYIEGVIGWK